jgi:hypothetical protein
VHRRSWSRTRPCSVSASRAATDTDLRSSGGRSRTCVSRLTVARLTARPRRNEGRRRESRTLNGRSRTRCRDGIPRPWQSFRMAPAGVEPAPCRLRVGSSAVLSYGAVEVWPAGVEPAARRVSGDRSTALSYGHEELRSEWARLDSNQQPLVCKTSALRELSYSPGDSGTRIRTSTSAFRARCPGR